MNSTVSSWSSSSSGRALLVATAPRHKQLIEFLIPLFFLSFFLLCSAHSLAHSRLESQVALISRLPNGNEMTASVERREKRSSLRDRDRDRAEISNPNFLHRAPFLPPSDIFPPLFVCMKSNYLFHCIIFSSYPPLVNEWEEACDALLVLLPLPLSLLLTP